MGLNWRGLAAAAAAGGGGGEREGNGEGEGGRRRELREAQAPSQALQALGAARRAAGSAPPRAGLRRPEPALPCQFLVSRDPRPQRVHLRSDALLLN